MNFETILSIIVPIYNEEDNIKELQKRIAAILETAAFNETEIILVDDGSYDSSRELISDIVTKDGRFKGIFLSRNFGHQAAVSTGLKICKGSVAVIIDGDLQDPPEYIVPMLEKLNNHNAQVVYGVRKNRKENGFKKFLYWIFYRLLQKISDIEIPLDSGDFCCITREVVDNINFLPENRRFVRGLRSWVGFKQLPFEYEREERFAGKPKYTLHQLFRLAYDGFFSFSEKPIKLIQILGLLCSTISLIIALTYLILTFILFSPPGFPTIIISIWFIGGIIIFFLGLIGEYIHRIFEQVLGRPYSIIQEIIQKDKE